MTRKISGDQIVVKGSESGALFPTNREECFKEILVDGRSKEFSLDSGAFSPNLEILGGGRVKGPVFSSENLRIENDGKKGPQCFLSGAFAHDTILAETAGDSKVENSPAASSEGIRFVIRGDVVAGRKIMLRNTCVVGSVCAPNVHLQNSVVLGNIVAKNELQAICSGLSLFRTRKLELNGPTKIFIAGGISKEKPQVAPYEELGSVYDFLMVYQPLCRKLGVANEGWLCEENEYPNSIQMGLYDFLEVKSNNLPEFIGEDLLEIGVNKNGGEEVYFFGTQGRALEMNSVEEFNDRFNAILHGVFAFEHLTPEKREEQRMLWEEHLSPYEQKIMQYATEGI